MNIPIDFSLEDYEGIKMTAKKPLLKIRLPRPRQIGHPHGTKKGKKGYRRKGRRIEKINFENF